MTWHQLTQSVGSCLATRRKILNLSLDYLALEAFVDKVHLRKIEQGRANSSLRMMSKIVRVLQTTVYEVYEHAEKPRSKQFSESSDSF